MPIISVQQYVSNRQAYSYSDSQIAFNIHQTGSLPYSGNFQGIFPGVVPATHPSGVNLRRFEKICLSVFNDAARADAIGNWTPHHIENLQQIALAIVHWKMSSQGGRSTINVNNVRTKWNAQTHIILLRAYQHQSLCEFKIGGVRIPTASAFLRFLHPDRFGIVDSRVANNHTQPAGITTMSIRNDGYINDVQRNLNSYTAEYIPFLTSEMSFLHRAGATFNDIDEHGNPIVSQFRVCDIEMALF